VAYPAALQSGDRGQLCVPGRSAKLCVNGNEWAKRQAVKAGIGFEALDNGFAAVDDVEALQRICDSFGPEHIEALLRTWLKILPKPVHVRG
jgi:hypothetical protein